MTREPKKSSQKPLSNLLVGFFIGIILCVGIYFSLGSNSADNIEVNFSGKALKLKVHASEIHSDELLKKLFDSTFSREGTLGWLREKQIFSVKDGRLADYIKRLPWDNPLSSAIREMRKDYQGPFRNDADSVTLSVPGYQVPEGIIYCVMGSVYQWEKIKIYKDKSFSNFIEVTCKPGIPFTDSGQLNHFHVGVADFQNLFGAAYRPVSSQTSAWIQVESD